jgi:hypothetical protein
MNLLNMLGSPPSSSFKFENVLRSDKDKLIAGMALGHVDEFITISSCALCPKKDIELIHNTKGEFPNFSPREKRTGSK